MADIENIFDPWEGHTHAEVEAALKSTIAMLQGGNYSQIAVSIVGALNRTFVATAEKVTFFYKVNSTVDGTYNPDFTVEITIGNSVITITDVKANSSDDEIETPNLAPYLAQIGNDVITVKIRAYTADGLTAATKSLKYTRQSATLSTDNQINTVDPRVLRFQAQFTGASAKLICQFYGATGSLTENNAQTVTNVLNLAGAATVTVPELDAGAHIVKAYLLLEDEETKSETLVTSIFTTKDAQEDDVYISYEEIKGATEKDYYEIVFSAFDPALQDTDSLVVLLREWDATTRKYIKKGERNISNRSRNTWKYLVPKTSNQVQIAVPYLNEDGSIATNVQGEPRLRNSIDIIFDAVASNITWIQKENPVIYLTAQNRTNNDADKDVWTNNGYEVAFTNVQFDNNTGWFDENHLHLVGTARARIKNFYPFYNDTAFVQNSVGGGILSTGFTMKMSFRVTGVSDANKRVIDCYSDKDGVGFYVTGDSIYIGVGANLLSRPDEVQSATNHNSRRFSANTRIDLTIAVQPYYTDGVATKHEARYYINGEIAGFGIIPNQTLSQLLANRTEIVFGGDGAALDLYDFRYYNSYTNAFDILQTRTMDLDDAGEMSALYRKNNFYELDGTGYPIITVKQAIAYGKYLAEQAGGKIPFAVVVATDFCNNVSLVGNNIPEGGFQGSTKATNNTDRQDWYKFGFTVDDKGKGIIDPEETYWLEGKDPGSLRARRQGTSTKDSTKGNVRWDVRKTIRLHWFDALSQTFSAEYTEYGKGGNVFFIPDRQGLPCYLLTMKKNPNESTQARNLPSAKIYEDSARYLATVQVQGEYIYEDCLTPPQRKELASIVENFPNLTRTEQVAMIKTRQCVDGIPSIAFEMKRTNSDSILRDPTSNAAVTAFAGQFDLITDKTNMKVFGFGGYWTVNADGTRTWHDDEVDETFSVEFRDNASPICNFHTYDISAGGVFKSDGTAGTSHLEYRYPDTDTVCGDIIPTGKDCSNRGLETTGPMQRLFDFVYNCSPYNIGDQALNGAHDPNYNNKITIKGVQVVDNAANRKSKFHQELGYYVVLHQILLNAVQIDNNLMCDQDTKNQFFSFFTGVLDTVDDWEGNKHKLLRLLGYDFDSSLGCDNDNFFKFLYTVLYTDGLYDGKHNGRGPDFWALIFEVFKDEIKTIYNHLYQAGILTSEGILKYMHANQVDLYNAMIYNANSEYSYTSISSDYQKAHGSAKEHNEWFVRNRSYFKGGENYVFGGAASDFSTDNVQFNVSAYSNIPDAGNKYWHTGANGIKRWAIDLTAYERTFAYLTIGNTLHDGGFIEVKETVVNNIITGRQSNTLTLKTNADNIVNESGADFRVGIRGCKRLKTINDLSHWYISSIYTGWGDLVNLEEINLGRYEQVEDAAGNKYDYNNPNLTDLNTKGLIFGCCKKLNIAGLSNLNGVVDLTCFPVLEVLEARNDGRVEEFILPSTDNLKVLNLPAGLTKVTINNKPNIKEINLQSMDNVMEVTITGSNNYSAATFGIDVIYDFINS